MNVISNTVTTALPQLITCCVSDQDIYQADFYGNKQVIGVTVAKYKELEQLAQKYYDKLVELKVIVPPKTPEDAQKEMLEGMQTMLGELKDLRKKVEVLENVNSTDNSADAEIISE